MLLSIASLRSLCLPLAALLMGGCAGVNQANHLGNPFAPASPLGDAVVKKWEQELPATDVTKIATRKERNDLIYQLIFLSDYRFSRYEADLMLGKATRDSFIDLSMFGLNAATSLITPGSATQVLAAIASGLGFSRNTVEKNFYMNHTAPLLMAKMRALRKEKLNDIVRNLSRGIDDYPATLAIIDVLDYYNRGTMLGALQAISNDTAMQDIQAAGGKVIPPPMAKPVAEQIKDGTIAAQSGTFTKRPVRQATEAPHYVPDRPDDVAATASQVIKTINTKAVSVEQLNRFCDEADLLHPELPPTGTPSDLLDAAREQVTKKVREITGGPQIQKAATAAKNIFK